MSEQEIKGCPFCGNRLNRLNCHGPKVGPSSVCCEFTFGEGRSERCEYSGPSYDEDGEPLNRDAAIAAHNDLCDLVEKGRRYGEDVDERDDLIALQLRCMKNADDYYHGQTGADPKTHSDLTVLLNWLTDRCKSGDKGVRLLRHWVSVLKSAHSLGYSGCNADSTDAFLADKKGGGE